jgi:hypothetical protein
MRMNRPYHTAARRMANPCVRAWKSSVFASKPELTDEIVTVIEGTWYLGAGERFDAAKLQAYPAGSFVVIPAGLLISSRPRTGRRSQSSGNGVFRTDFLEK